MCALAVIEWAVWSKVECDRMVCSAGKAGIIPLYWAGVANFTKTNIYPMPHASTHQQHSDAFNPTISHWTTRSTSLLWPSFQKRILYTVLTGRVLTISFSCQHPGLQTAISGVGLQSLSLSNTCSKQLLNQTQQFSSYVLLTTWCKVNRELGFYSLIVLTKFNYKRGKHKTAHHSLTPH